jgi:hypothetical protein
LDAPQGCVLLNFPTASWGDFSSQQNDEKNPQGGAGEGYVCFTGEQCIKKYRIFKYDGSEERQVG